MRHIFSKRSVLGCCVTAAICLSSAFSSFANLTGNWVHHGGAALTSKEKESRVYKIIDGNKHVYMLARGISFNQSNQNYLSTLNLVYWVYTHLDPIQIFCYDKDTELKTENFKFLPGMVDLSGYRISIAEYSPKDGILVLGYDDNKIDLVTDDGEVKRVHGLSGGTINGTPVKIHSITFDTEKPICYIAGTFGYAAINMAKGEIEKTVSTNHGVAWAGRVGDKMVLFAGDNISQNAYHTTAYAVDLEENNVKLEGKEIHISSKPKNAKVNADLTLPNLQALMPLDNNNFGAIAEYTSDTNYSLITVNLSDGTINELVESGNFDNASHINYRHLFRTDGRYWLTKDGYGISDSNNTYLLGLDSQITQINVSGLTATEKAAKIGTTDGKRFWMHTYDDAIKQRGIYYKDLSDGKWSAASEIIRPFGATSSLPMYIKYHPTYGMLFRGPGSYKSTAGEKDMISSYKDGKWTDRSVALSDETNFWAVSEFTRYIDPDPISPNLIWNASMLGLTRMDFEDPSNLIVYGATGRKGIENTYKGVFGVFENPAPGASSNGFTSNVAFDKNGTMWFTFNKVYKWEDYNEDIGSDFNQKIYMPLMYLTAEERASMVKPADDRSQLVIPHEIRVGGTMANNYDRLIAMKSPGNENYIVQTKAFYVNDLDACKIYDHNGTLEDTSDDRFVILYDMVNEDGLNIRDGQEYNIYEDMTKGELWLLTENGPYVLNPSEALNGSKVMRRLRISKSNTLTTDEYPLEQIAINEIADDIYGRKWLATESGIYCLSKDSEELLAHFTSENAPLPSNVIYGVGCDMESGAIFFGTEYGIVEFQPEGQATTPVSQPLTIWPQVITPDYQGYLNCAGALAGREYAIFDKNGKKVMDLGKPVDGMFQIHPVVEGIRIEAGKYSIRLADSEEGIENTFIVM